MTPPVRTVASEPMPRAGRLQRYARGSHAGVAGRPRLGKAPVSWKINPKEGQTMRRGSREDHEEFLMDIETVIGRFREDRLGRRRVVGRPRRLRAAWRRC